MKLVITEEEVRLAVLSMLREKNIDVTLKDLRPVTQTEIEGEYEETVTTTM